MQLVYSWVEYISVAHVDSNFFDEINQFARLIEKLNLYLVFYFISFIFCLFGIMNAIIYKYDSLIFFKEHIE